MTSVASNASGELSDIEFIVASIPILHKPIDTRAF